MSGPNQISSVSVRVRCWSTSNDSCTTTYMGSMLPTMSFRCREEMVKSGGGGTFIMGCSRVSLCVVITDVVVYWEIGGYRGQGLVLFDYFLNPPTLEVGPID